MTLENNKNEDALKLALSQVKLVREEMYAGGGKKAKEKQKEKNKQTNLSCVSFKFFEFLTRICIPNPNCVISTSRNNSFPIS